MCAYNSELALYAEFTLGSGSPNSNKRHDHCARYRVKYKAPPSFPDGAYVYLSAKRLVFACLRHDRISGNKRFSLWRCNGGRFGGFHQTVCPGPLLNTQSRVA
jgi:hypothetical protein